MNKFKYIAYLIASYDNKYQKFEIHYIWNRLKLILNFETDLFYGK